MCAERCIPGCLQSEDHLREEYDVWDAIVSTGAAISVAFTMAAGVAGIAAYDCSVGIHCSRCVGLGLALCSQEPTLSVHMPPSFPVCCKRLMADASACSTRWHPSARYGHLIADKHWSEQRHWWWLCRCSGCCCSVCLLPVAG